MPLNPKMILASDLQSLFRDKDTGLPLSGGTIHFFSDNEQGTPKAVYQLTGTAFPNYEFTPLEYVITLSSIGTVQDELGNQIVIYWYPFEGTPEEDSDVVENYFVRVYNSEGILQFDRHAWPNFNGRGLSENDQINFIPNGQFLAHLDGDAQLSTQLNIGVVNLDVKNIAWGGWTQEDQVGVGGTYLSEFTAIPAGSSDLNDFPPFVLDYSSTSAAVGVHQIGIKWRDVNQFEANDQHANLGDTTYTLFFYAQSNGITSYEFELFLIKYFGTGGSPTEVTSITDITIPATISPSETFYQNIAFSFGSNIGKTVGEGSYVQLALRPKAGVTTTFDIRLTDFCLALGDLSLSSFPPMTNAQMLSQAVAGWMSNPNPDGSDLYLPLVLTADGMTFDDSSIGSIVAKTTTTAVNNELLCDGSAYITSDYNATTGVPYSRLFNKLFNNGNSYNIPLFGTGLIFATAYINSGNTAQIVLCTNNSGSQTATANGASSPGFTITTASTGAAGILYNGWANSSGIITGFLSPSGAPLAGSGAGTSGLTITDYNNPSLGGYNYAWQTTALTAAALGNGAGAGKYFLFSTVSTNYYMWFKTATETDPAVGGRTGIQCTLDLTMGVADVANVIAQTLSRFQVSYITVGNAASITTGSYFTFYANSVAYNVWYKKDGSGIEPVVSNLIQVDITTGQTAAQVASATQIAINSYQFAVPDLRGAFLRGTDTAARWDLDYTSRFGVGITNVAAGAVGSWELSQFEKHLHTATTAVTLDQGSTAAAGGGSYASGVAGAQTYSNGRLLATTTIAATGGSESRPVNMSVNYFIKY